MFICNCRLLEYVLFILMFSTKRYFVCVLYIYRGNKDMQQNNYLALLTLINKYKLKFNPSYFAAFIAVLTSRQNGTGDTSNDSNESSPQLTKTAKLLRYMPQVSISIYRIKTCLHKFSIDLF